MDKGWIVMVFPRRNQMPRSPQPPFRNGRHDLRGIPREIRNTNGAVNTKGESRGLASLLSGSGGGGVTQSLAQSGGVSTLSKTLGGVQQVLGVVQSTAPLVQEYGPMIKNLPSMYRMMKAFKTFSKEDSEEISEEERIPPERPNQTAEINKQPEQMAKIKEEPVQNREKGVSTPRLYV